jgi:CRISPR-associated protein Cas5h
MEIEKALVFDLWGDYAHFRKIETTTSPLTYSFPTGTALSGLIAAIIGLERDSYYDLFNSENASFALRILSPTKKIRINLNLIKTDEGFYLWDIKENPRAPAPFEFVKEPQYRIYCWLKDEKKFKELKNYLEKHQSVYTPYLGISELIADFRFVGEIDAKAKEVEGEEEIHSVIRRDKANVIVEEGKRYALENMPLFMDKDRKVLEYGDMIFETNGKPLRVNHGLFYEIGEENVIPL